MAKSAPQQNMNPEEKKISMNWTDADIDVAYVMGMLNADTIESRGDSFPSVPKVDKKLKRLIELGYKRPSALIKALRYPFKDISSTVSEREIEIIQLVSRGLTAKEIGKELFISSRTVNAHMRRVMKRLKCHNSSSLVYHAMKSGLIQ